MPRMYPLRTQLNTGAPTDGDDCGPLAIINAIKWASDNKINIKQSEVGPWVQKIRRWADRPWGGFFLERDCLRVYRHPEFRKEFYKRGLHPPFASYHRGLSWDAFTRRLKNGEYGHLPVDYGTLADGSAPIGSYTFRGAHYVGLLHAPRLTSQRGRITVWDGDSLFDGRRDSIPDGWQATALVNFKRAAGDWGKPRAGYGRCYAITLKRNLGEYKG